jgi:hypothetical protein
MSIGRKGNSSADVVHPQFGRGFGRKKSAFPGVVIGMRPPTFADEQYQPGGSFGGKILIGLHPGPFDHLELLF